MFITRPQFKKLLTSFNFQELFLTLGWDNVKYNNTLDVSGIKYKLDGIVQKRGFIVIACNSNDGFPDANTRKKIDKQISRLNFEHLIIYHDNSQKQIWQISIKEPNKPIQIREFEYLSNQEPSLLYSKLDGFLFTLDEEDKIGLVDVKSRVTEQFNKNAEKVTKKFYTEFKKHHIAFQKFIEGLETQTDIDWYTSLMLNRLMFVYFIQKKGFLDGNTNYLSDKLKETIQKNGNNKFYKSFYRTFLIRLFHKGLGNPNHSKEFQLELGKIPYLNGGLFDVHELEKNNDKLNIPDEAFEKLFAFFDQYNWHLDVRADASGNDINPDVIGYIFEKYINDRASMGAYYTKEDITEYIGKNTIIPFLFDRVKENVKNAFAPESSLWKMLKETPDRYIYDAVSKGVPKEGGLFDDLPDEIKKGFRSDLGTEVVKEATAPHLWEIRKVWNKKAPEEIALPTETYRELIERRKRYAEIKNKILNGEITGINDFITYNLNIRQFAQDAVEQYEGSDFINTFYNAIKEITILDPTAGSGAFLFAALNILEPLYEAAISRMREFVSIDNEKGTGKKHTNFRSVLEEIAKHYNEKYYIYKSIILNNLYGVDIMKEATEIAKLRLFLKLVAVVDPDEKDENYGLEPLPDIDFNIRAGNTLVGFASYKEIKNAFEETEGNGRLLFGEERKVLQNIDDQANIVADLFREFKKQQTINNPNSLEYKETKEKVNKRLDELNDLLNKYLAFEYGINADDLVDQGKYKKWLISHKPFHWFAEFYEIIHQHGGFDVIIGNPPYIVNNKSNINYKLQEYTTENCRNLYAFVLERAFKLSRLKYNSFIIPSSAFGTPGTLSLRKHIIKEVNICYISYFSGDAHPAILFEGVKLRLAIIITKEKSNSLFHLSTTKYMRWYSEERQLLFQNLFYSNVSKSIIKDTFPKINMYFERRLIEKIHKQRKTISNYYNNKPTEFVFYYHNAPVFFIRSMNFVPKYESETTSLSSSNHFKKLYTFDEDTKAVLIAILNSNTFFYWFANYSANRDLTSFDIQNFPIDLENIIQKTPYSEIVDVLMNDLKKNSKMREYNYTTGTIRYQEFYLRESKPIIDEIDKALAEHYGFTEEELDFIINYDIKYRMGKEMDAYIEGKLGGNKNGE